MADNTERLLLQVDAATELLRRHLAEGEQPLAKFEQRAAKMGENVDRSIADMGKRFGPFAQLAEDSAKRAERAFQESFSDIQKLAAKAIETPVIRGNVNIGAADARAAADNAQRQALATRLVAEAAERAAAGEGVLTERTRLYVQAARAASIEAEHHATELAREAGALERVEIELNQAGAGAQLMALRQRGAANSAGALRAASQGASYQLQDTFTQLSMGANVFQVVAIQGGQLAGQFANIEGKAGNVARFMIGPWGLAFTAALLVLGPLTKGMFDFGNALDDEVVKLKENASSTALAEEAKKAFLRTEAGAIDDVRALTAELHKQNDTLKTNAELSNIRAKSDLKTLQDQREGLAKELTQARAALRATNATTSGGIAGSSSVIQGQAAEKVRALDERLKAVDTSIASAQAAVNTTRAALADEAARRSIDPIAQINRRYDGPNGLIEQAKKRALAEGTVTTALTRQLETLRAQQKAEVDAEQKRHSARTRTPNNDQIGRTINEAEARSIVASIGGRVTSGTRSNERQQELYADYLAGRHKGPVAKPGTSDHERGQAVDVAYGPGISIASLKDAFRKQGVALRQIIDEPAQRVIHVAFGKAGASPAAVAKREESARQKVLADDTAYTNEERQARRRLIDATRKTAATEQQRENLLAEDISAEATARNREIANDLSAGKISKAQAEHLTQLNEATRTQRLQNLIVERATRQIDRRYEVEQSDLEGRLTLLRLDEGLATTEAERRKVAQQILEIEQQLRRKALERLRDTSQDPNQVQNAKTQLARLPAIEQREQQQADRANAGPLDQYRQRLKGATEDMNAALEGVAVNGLQSIEDGFVGIIDGTESVGSAFKKMAASIIADLARIAIEKAILSAIGAGTGAATGGRIGDLPGFSEGGTPGGLIQGPGTGTSDSILAVLGNGRGAIRVSTEEFIVNAAATKRNLPLLHAINSGRTPGYAAGGSLGSPALPSLRSPRLPSSVTSGTRGRDRLLVDGEIRVSPTPEFDARMERVSYRTVGAVAEPIMSGAEARTIRTLNRPSLPGVDY